jgi:hypothetical protein
MIKKISASLSVLALTLALASAPAHAGAAFGYVCIVSLQPATMSKVNGFGDEGELQIILNSQPDCGGSQVAYVYVFSVGATLAGANLGYLYTAGELQAIYQALVTSRNKAVQRQVGLGLATTNTVQALTVAFY